MKPKYKVFLGIKDKVLKKNMVPENLECLIY